jgi:O-methyltransferase/8-demethyl-8-(2,3-dimethoxy-alpha-L-rhamnosyl)tetracenomycin-C 4'-O-methyltransferase
MPCEAELRALYLDLIQKCLTNTIYEDPPQDPWTGGRFDARTRDRGLDWPSKAHTMIGGQRMNNLRRIIEHVIVRGIPGDFIETGLWRGGACIFMRAILKAYGVTDRIVWCADSFEGLPKPDAARYPLDAGDAHHTYESLRISLDEVKANFAKYGLLDEQVKFLKGFFKDTLPTAPIERLSVLRVDADMYQSTTEALTCLYDKVTVGGFVIVDDYGALPPCRSATDDFRRQRGIADPICNIDGIGVFWQKTASG